jgi:hypothetical protein
MKSGPVPRILEYPHERRGDDSDDAHENAADDIDERFTTT